MTEGLEQATNIVAGTIQQGFTELSTTVNEKLKQIKIAIKKQEIIIDTPPFSGKPSEFRAWINAINKALVLNPHLTDDEKVRLALRHSRGDVSDYIGLYIEQRVHDQTVERGWGHLKNQLILRFGECNDKHHAYASLFKIKQKPDENVQVYSTRLSRLALDAFDSLDPPEVQRQLVQLFIDGMSDDHMKIKIMHQKPTTLTAAADSALSIQNFHTEVKMRLGKEFVPTRDPEEVVFPRLRPVAPDPPYPTPTLNPQNPLPAPRTIVPMEIGHMRYRRRPRTEQFENACFNCKREGHIARNCPERTGQPQAQKRPTPKNRLN